MDSNSYTDPYGVPNWQLNYNAYRLQEIKQARGWSQLSIYDMEGAVCAALRQDRRSDKEWLRVAEEVEGSGSRGCFARPDYWTSRGTNAEIQSRRNFQDVRLLELEVQKLKNLKCVEWCQREPQALEYMLSYRPSSVRLLSRFNFRPEFQDKIQPWPMALPLRKCSTSTPPSLLSESFAESGNIVIFPLGEMMTSERDVLEEMAMEAWKPEVGLKDRLFGVEVSLSVCHHGAVKPLETRHGDLLPSFNPHVCEVAMQYTGSDFPSVIPRRGMYCNAMSMILYAANKLGLSDTRNPVHRTRWAIAMRVESDGPPDFKQWVNGVNANSLLERSWMCAIQNEKVRWRIFVLEQRPNNKGVFDSDTLGLVEVPPFSHRHSTRLNPGKTTDGGRVVASKTGARGPQQQQNPSTSGVRTGPIPQRQASSTPKKQTDLSTPVRQMPSAQSRASLPKQLQEPKLAAATFEQASHLMKSLNISDGELKLDPLSELDALATASNTDMAKHQLELEHYAVDCVCYLLRPKQLERRYNDENQPEAYLNTHNNYPIIYARGPATFPDGIGFDEIKNHVVQFAASKFGLIGPVSSFTRDRWAFALTVRHETVEYVAEEGFEDFLIPAARTGRWMWNLYLVETHRTESDKWFETGTLYPDSCIDQPDLEAVVRSNDDDEADAASGAGEDGIGGFHRCIWE